MPEATSVVEAKYLAELQKRWEYTTSTRRTGRNVITTHSFRAFFITKVSRKDPNLAKHFAGQKGYLLQYDRQTDAEKLAIYIKLEPLLLVSDKARDQEKIRKLEQENARMRKFENLKRGNKDLKKENKDLKSEGTRRPWGWQKNRYASWKVPFMPRSRSRSSS